MHDLLDKRLFQCSTLGGQVSHDSFPVISQLQGVEIHDLQKSGAGCKSKLFFYLQAFQARCHSTLHDTGGSSLHLMHWQQLLGKGAAPPDSKDRLSNNALPDRAESIL